MNNLQRVRRRNGASGNVVTQNGAGHDMMTRHMSARYHGHESDGSSYSPSGVNEDRRIDDMVDDVYAEIDELSDKVETHMAKHTNLLSIVILLQGLILAAFVYLFYQNGNKQPIVRNIEQSKECLYSTNDYDVLNEQYTAKTQENQQLTELIFSKNDQIGTQQEEITMIKEENNGLRKENDNLRDKQSTVIQNLNLQVSQRDEALKNCRKQAEYSDSLYKKCNHELREYI